MTAFTSHRSVRHKRSSARRRPQRSRPELEALEDRIVPSYFPSTANGIHIFEDQLPDNLSTAMTQFVATHIDGTQKELLDQTEQFRAINPNFTVLHYQLGTGNSPYDYIINNQWASDWSYVNSQESWFVHQSYSGEPQSAADLASGRVGNSTGWDQADISNPAWQQYTLNQVFQNMAATGSNGWFADSFTFGISAGGYDGTIPTRYQGTNAANPSVWPNGVDWTDQLANWAQTVETAFAQYNAANGTDYQFIPNLDARTTSWEPDWYDNANGVPFLDGAFFEGFGEATDTYDWTLSMNQGLNFTDNGKIVIMQPYPSSAPTTAAGQQQIDFLLGTYLLLKGNETYLNIDYGGGVQYYPQYELNLGTAVTPLPSNVSGYLWDGVYRRDFQNGFVLVNPGSTTYTLNLGGTYQLVQGSGGGEMTDSDLDANGNYIGGSLSYQNVNSITLTGGSAAIFMDSSSALTVAKQATAATNPIDGTSVALTVLGQENGSDSGLTYTWSSTGPANVSFSDNGDNSAKNVTATFTEAGAYTLTATISDGTHSVTSSVQVTVDQTVTSVEVSPTSANVFDGATKQFSATAFDQFGMALTTQPTFTWSIDSGGVGTVSKSGLYTAPATGTGTASVRATTGADSAAATVDVYSLTVAKPATAATNPVDGTSVAMSVLGQENGSDSGLTYTWSSTGPAAVSFSDNGDNSAKNVTATFTQAGSYTLTATISDGTHSVTSSVTVTVAQMLSSVVVSPTSANLVDGATEQFTATALDQFGLPLTTQPSFTWSIDSGGVGTVNESGLYTAPASGTGSASVRATTGADSAAATVSVFTPTMFTSADSAVFTVGQPGQFTVTTTGEFTAAISADVAPFSFHDNGNGTATISGTPSATVGTYLFNITANNGHTAPIVQVFTLTVIDPPTITSADTATFTAGTPGSFTITSTAGLPTKTTFHVGGTLPSGVTLHDNGNGTATLTGTATAKSGGVYLFTISASNGSLATTTQQFTLTVNVAPTFTSASTATFIAGAPGSFAITTLGYPSATLNAGGPPSWLTFTPASNGTAMLTGTPTAAAKSAVTLTATPSAGKAVTQTLTITVAQAPTLSDSGSSTFTVGKAGTFTIVASGGSPGTTTFSESGTVPAGLAFAASGDTLRLTGTPKTGSGNLYTIAVTAGNGPARTSQTFTFTVDEAPAFTSATSATFAAGQADSFLVTTRGYPVPTLTASGLPSWLTFAPASNGTGTLTGTPTSAAASTVTLTAGAGVTQTLTITVAQAPTLSSSGSSTFTVAKAGAFTITASGGSPGTTTFSESGTPAGLAFTASGDTLRLTGTPKAGSGGVYAVTVSAGNGPARTSQTFAITVDQTPAFTSAKTATLVAGQPADLTITTQGYPSATLSAGTLPGWLTFTSGSNGSATLTGTPSSPGVSTVTLTAGTGVTQTLSITVAQTPTLSDSGSSTFTVGKAGTFTIVASGGSPGTTTFSESGTVPAGLAFAASGDTLRLTGTPKTGSGNLYTIAVTAGNGPARTSQTFTFTVDEAPAFTSATSATFAAGQADSFLVTTRGYPAAALSIAGTLPAGVSFIDNHNGTGTLVGIPLAGTGGQYPVTLSSGTASQTFTVTVTQPPLITSPASTTFTLSQSSGFTVSVSGFTVPTLSYSGTLPSGMSWTTFTGKSGALISGTPTKVGTYTVTITATAGSLPPAAQTFVLIVA